MTQIDLITGILGAGKTTFIRQYARFLMQRGERIAILENDFGAVNVDMMLLQDLKCEQCQLEMISGGGDPDCHKRRFKTQLIALGMQHFDRVIIEPSGIYDMDEFFDTLHESPLDRWFEVGSILTIIDAETEETLSPAMEFLFASEAACAGKLLLSKVPADESAADCTVRLAAHLNQALHAIQCPRQFSSDDFLTPNWNAFTNADFEAAVNAGYRCEPYVKQWNAESFRSNVHYFLHIHIPEAEIAPTLAKLMDDSRCGEIFRIKGSLQDDNGEWLKINITRKKAEIAPVADGQAVLIVIGEQLSLEVIDQYLKAVNTDEQYASI